MVQDLDFDIELANNQEQRLPCVLVLDTSYSMSGSPLEELQGGLELFAHELKTDDDASQKVQILIVKCGGDAEIIGDWVDAESFTAPHLVASGGTPLGAAIKLAADEIENRKATYRANGISYLKPWLFIITDGIPTDNYSESAKELVTQETNGKFTTFPIAVEGADLNIMSEFSVRPPQKLNGTEFKKLFQWISASVRIGSQKVDDTDKISLPSVNWAEV